MTDRKIAKYNLEKVGHANGSAHNLAALVGGRFVTKKQTNDMIESYPLRKNRKIQRFVAESI